MTAPDATLEDIRKEIDAIDDGLVDLMAKRIAASLKVRQQKSTAGSLAVSPIRPAREAMILRRLVLRAGGAVPPELLVRLWRVILSSSTQAQADVTIHVASGLAASVGAQRMLTEHFGAMRIESHADEARALLQVSKAAGDLCVVDTASRWADCLTGGAAGEARVIGTLPTLKVGKVPGYLVFGHAAAQPTGDDETLVISAGRLPRDFAPVPLWQTTSGSCQVSCLPGFLSEHEGALLGLTRSNAALEVRIAGRFPSQIEVK
jgi:chorismate mutase / prephenate dehydratase